MNSELSTTCHGQVCIISFSDIQLQVQGSSENVYMLSNLSLFPCMYFGREEGEG